jgi:PKD repeat protein
MLKFLFIISLSFIGTNILAQGEADNWFFGSRAGINFNSGKPIPQTGILYSSTGSSAISNKEGKLLFYSNGYAIFDNTHNLMPNGHDLRPNKNAWITQTSIIIPFPDSVDLFYLFTVNLRSGIVYSIIDMKLNSSRGDVIKDKRNIPLFNLPTCEKISGVQHANGKDFWIVFLKSLSDSLYSYKITALGIDTIPVITKTGLIVPADNQYTAGQMKISTDGKKIAWANHNSFNGYLTCGLGDFNNMNGTVSNFLKFEPAPFRAWGLEFSQNTKYLYITQKLKEPKILQFDAQANSELDLNSSKVTIDSGFSNDLGDMQLAPNGKIYLCELNNNYLHVINAPDSADVKCGFERNAFNLLGNKCTLGLPNFISSFLKPRGYIAKQNCSDTVFFKLGNYINLTDSVRWDFGDFGSGNLNYSNLLQNVYHVFKDTGSYKVSLLRYYGNFIDTFSEEIKIKRPIANFVAEDVCENDTILFLNKSNHLANNQWFFGDGQYSSSESPKHIYIINGLTKSFNVRLTIISNLNCRDSVTKKVTINATPISEFTYNIDGIKVKFNALQKYNKFYEWKFGDGGTALTDSCNYYFIKKPSGKYVTCLKVMNSSNCISQTCKEILISGNIEIFKENQITVYPNPNRGSFKVDNISVGTTLSIFNAFGSLVKSIEIKKERELYNIELTPGIYFIRGNTLNTNYVIKLMIE